MVNQTTDEPNLSPTMERFLNGRDDKLHEDEPLRQRRANPGTTITADALVARGYTEFPSTTDEAKRLFQKRMDDDKGARYFVNFREWDHPKRVVSFDAQICCDTNSHGYCWATIQEESIEQAEARAEAIWLAMGSVYYDL